MRFAVLSAALLYAFIAPAIASVNNKAVAATVEKQSYTIKKGKYRFVNAKTGQGLKYVRSNQQLYPAKGKGDWMTISTHHKHVVISPSSSNSKCLSAAWNYSTGSDNHGALYRCQVPHSKRDSSENEKREEPQQLGKREMQLDFVDIYERSDYIEEHQLEKRVALRGAKQYFYLHPAHGVKNGWHIVAYDHITDMKTRVVGGSSAPAPWARKTRLVNIVQLNEKDKSQVWYVYNSKGKRV